MTKENSLIKIWIGLAIVIFLSYALVMNVSASARDGRSDRTDTSRGEETSPAPDPEPTLPKFPKPSQGGITSDTNGSVNTGGNSGGNVTTGDELLEVIEINIGPTNPPEEIVEDDEENATQPSSEPNCEGNRRDTQECRQENSGRNR